MDQIYLRAGGPCAFLGRAEQLRGKRPVRPVGLPGGYGRFAIFAGPDRNPGRAVELRTAR